MGVTNTKFASQGAAYGSPIGPEFTYIGDEKSIQLDMCKPANIGNKTSAMYCDVCLGAKSVVFADSFCVTCELFTCDTCVSNHGTGDNSEQHVILRKDEMPPTKRQQGDLFSCTTHVRRPVKYLCKDHMRVCCSLCVIESHSTCGRVQYMSDTEFNQTGIFEQFSKRLLQSKSESNDNISSKCHFIKDILVRHKNDRHQSWITDLKLLTNGHLALIDHNNGCLKIMDVRTSTFMSYLTFERTNKPWALCQDSSKNIIVTCGYEILILDSLSVTVVKMISVSDWTRGISCDKDLLVYACTSPRPAVKMITKDGHLVKSYEVTEDGQDMFVCPWSVVINPNKNIIYIADVGNSMVTAINKQDDSTNVYRRQKMLSRPQGLALGSRDNILICGQGNIHDVTGDFKREHVVLVDRYHGVCFDDINNLLYTSYNSVYRKAHCVSIFRTND